MNLYIYSYNNYYNRIVKKAGDNIDDYSQWLHYGPVTGVYGFTPGDGINTVQVIGTNVQMYDGKGDYLIAHNPDTDEIDSRWFIVDINRTRNGQWELTLHRDLVIDYYDVIINSPMFIEKATLLPNDPLIYNKESSMTLNLIKTKEDLLTDETGCAWLVGYVTRQSTANSQNPTPLSATIKYKLDFVPDYTVSQQSELPFYNLLDNEFSYTGEPTFDIFFKSGSEISFNSINRYGVTTCPLRLKSNATEQGYGWLITTGISESNFYYGKDKENYVYNYLNVTPLTTSWKSYGYGNRYFAQYLYNAIPESSWSTILNQVGLATNSSIQATVSEYANKVVQIGNSLYRTKIEVTNRSTDSTVLNQDLPLIEEAFRSIYNSAASAYLNTYSDSILSSVSTNISDRKKMLGVRTNTAGTVKLTLEPMVDTTVEAKIETDALATMCIDSPYDIITMPYSNTLKIKVNELGEVFTANKDLALATMTSLLAQQGGTGAVKDVQLLPYCPLRQFIDIDGNIDLTIQDSETQDFSTRVYYVTAEETQVRLTPLIYCQHSTDSFNIPYNINLENVKMLNECDMYRLTSPNFASSFEFNAAQNNGVQYFNVDFNYKPFLPYIHLNPNFSKLYGKDFDDPRGLICAGDFSITVITDAWEQYQLQNKNYEKTFQRQIDNMEVQHEVGRLLDIASGIVGTMTGAGSGAATGALVGGPVGAAIGGVVGGIASGIGGIADYQLNEKLRAEALDYTKDMYGYQLGNIQALPNTISKVSAFNRNNKIFPVIEYYTCTDEEKLAIANKIAWNGMSVGVISTISNYIGNTWSYIAPNNQTIKSEGYIKGKLIRLDFIDESIIEPHKQGVHSEDYRVVNAISGELNKGMFFKTGDL